MHRRNSLIVSFVSFGSDGGMYLVPRREHQWGRSGRGRGARQRPAAASGGTGRRASTAGRPDGATRTAASPTTWGRSAAARPPAGVRQVRLDGGGSDDRARTAMPAATCPSKWNQATTAVNTAVMQLPGRCSLGPQALLEHGQRLHRRPPARRCRSGPTTAARSRLPSAATGAGRQHADHRWRSQRGGDYLATLTTPTRSFMVLVTDGAADLRPAATATAADDANAIAAVTTQATRGFGTFVVGLATVERRQRRRATLHRRCRRTGGHPRAGTPNYYLANNTRRAW